jgi:hypothetical protein
MREVHTSLPIQGYRRRSPKLSLRSVKLTVHLHPVPTTGRGGGGKPVKINRGQSVRNGARGPIMLHVFLSSSVVSDVIIDLSCWRHLWPAAVWRTALSALRTFPLAGPPLLGAPEKKILTGTLSCSRRPCVHLNVMLRMCTDLPLLPLKHLNGAVLSHKRQLHLSTVLKLLIRFCCCLFHYL